VYESDGEEAAASDPAALMDKPDVSTMAVDEVQKLIDDLTAQMGAAARELKFELAGRLRDEIADLKKELRGLKEAGI
ncbi:UvrB/UvrC motif-containing protein, partial [Acinetobacter baumannii]|nr:UvrB/UvrC motif-containing protein [Acinetobacter baumannii]